MDPEIKDTIESLARIKKLIWEANKELSQLCPETTKDFNRWDMASRNMNNTLLILEKMIKDVLTE